MTDLLNLFAAPCSNEPFISDSTVHNIKLSSVLRLCLTEDRTSAVTAFLQRPFDTETLLQRQGFFKEFLYSDTLPDLLRKTQADLISAIQLAEQYEKEKNTDLKHFLYYRFMDVYTTALTNLVAAADTANSDIMSAFFARIKAFCEQDNVKQAIHDIGSIRLALRDLISQSYEIRLYGSFITSYDIKSPEKDTPLDTRLLALFEDMNMGIAAPPVKKELTGSIFNTYMWLLIKNNTQLRGTLSTYHTRHQQLFSHIMPIDFSDISIALNIRTLFEYLTNQEIPLTFPQVSQTRAACIHDFYDLSLLTQKISAIIPNDYICSEDEAIFILTGVNSGGKTTYLRGLGIAITFFAAGLFVPATSATIPIYDRIEALFAGRSSTRSGERFQQEKQMIGDAADKLTATSMLLVNEIFSSIDEKTAVDEYSRAIKTLQQKGCHSLLITHLHSLAQGVALPNIVSLTAMIGENAERLYKIKRFQGRSSNVAEILRKYALTPEQLAENLLQKGAQNNG